MMAMSVLTFNLMDVFMLNYLSSRYPFVICVIATGTVFVGRSVYSYRFRMYAKIGSPVAANISVCPRVI